MTTETKIYSDFIKRHNICVGINHSLNFTIYYNGKLIDVPLYKCAETGKWYAGDDDSSMTKKSAIYWYCKNNLQGLL